jgi:hypothetical protein
MSLISTTTVVGFELIDTLSSQQKLLNLTSVSSIPVPPSCTQLGVTKKRIVLLYYPKNLPGCELN